MRTTKSAAREFCTRTLPETASWPLDCAIGEVKRYLRAKLDFSRGLNPNAREHDDPRYGEAWWNR